MLAEGLEFLLSFSIPCRYIVQHIFVRIHEIGIWRLFRGELYRIHKRILKSIVRCRCHMIVNGVGLVLWELLRQCSHELVSQLYVLKSSKLMLGFRVQVLIGFLLQYLWSRVDSLYDSDVKEFVIMVLICFAILLESALRDIRMIERGLNPIVSRCFLVGPDSMELHRKRADCLLHGSDDCFLLMIFLLDIFKLLRQLAHFNSQLLLLITVCPN